jgi:peroxiredoxin
MPKRRCILGVAALCALLGPVGRAETPRPSPDLVVHLNGGKDLHVSQYKGKPLVLAFILTTCPHCQKTVGFLSKAHSEFAQRGLQIVAVAIEEAAAGDLPGFITAFNPPFPVGYNIDQKTVLDFLQHPPMLLLKMPVLVFIDGQGVVREQYEGDAPFMSEDKQEQNIQHAIEALLVGGAAGKKAVGKRPASGQ